MTVSAAVPRWILICCALAGFTLLGAGLAAAQETTPDPAASPTPTPVPRDCAECHLDIVAEWETSTHALAYHDPDFQTTWQAQRSDPQCLSCHTTGFSPRTNAFEQAGVACEACHGQTPANHPPEPVAVDPGVEVCADCHTTTFTEWQISAHGEQQLACTTCHTPHNQHLRFETANVLCLNCHDESRTDYAHVSHPDQACADCHWYRSPDETQHVLTGNLLVTGHDSQVETHTCVDCHADLKKDETVILASSSQHPLLEAELRINELQAQLQSSEAQKQNQSAVQLIQGLLVGALVMGLGIWGFLWFRGRSGQA